MKQYLLADGSILWLYHSCGPLLGTTQSYPLHVGKYDERLQPDDKSTVVLNCILTISLHFKGKLSELKKCNRHQEIQRFSLHGHHGIMPHVQKYKIHLIREHWFLGNANKFVCKTCCILLLRIYNRKETHISVVFKPDLS